MLNNMIDFLSLIRGRKIKTAATIKGTDIIPLGTRDANYGGGYQPTGITYAEFIASFPTGGVQSVTSNFTGVIAIDQTDPTNPVVNFNGVFTDNATITGNGIIGNPLVAAYQAPQVDNSTVTGTGAPGNPLVAPFQSPSVDNSTVTGNGTPGSPLVAPFQSPSVDGVTITGNGTPGNPLVAHSSGGGTVSYENVFFVDSIVGNDSTATSGNFTKPYLWISNAMNAAAASSPTATNRALVYVRAGFHNDLGGSNVIFMRNYVDVYFEPGSVVYNVAIDDYSNGVECRLFGKAYFYNLDYTNSVFRSTGPSNIVFEFDSMKALGAAIEIGSSANVTINGRYIYSQTLGKAFGITIRSSGTVVMNISESINAWHQTFLFKYFGGKCTINCPKITIQTGNYYGNNYKQVIQCADFNSGGTCEINGNLVNEDSAGYWGGISGMIGRWTGTDNMTLRMNGNIYAGDYWAYYALASTSLSKTIITGNITTNHLLGYASNSAQLVIRNGSLINYKTYSAATTYPVASMGGSAKVYFENCVAYGYGTTTGFTYKDSTACTLVISNVIFSNADGTGFFVKNTVGGTPVNNVRIHSSRSQVPLDTNIVDLLSPTGFIADTNMITPNFL